MKKKPKWYFIIQNSIITVRAQTRAGAFAKARAQVGLA